MIEMALEMHKPGQTEGSRDQNEAIYENFAKKSKLTTGYKLLFSE